MDLTYDVVSLINTRKQDVINFEGKMKTSTRGTGIAVIEPTSAFLKPVSVEWKDLLKALAKGLGHTAVGKWEELGNDTVDALASLGLSTEPGELASVLLRRALTTALFDLLGDTSAQLVNSTDVEQDISVPVIEFQQTAEPIIIDNSFIDRPLNSPFVVTAKEILANWLGGQKGLETKATVIADRLPSYFVYALNREWRKNAKYYAPLKEALNTPFTTAGEREWAWSAYSALLQRRIEEPTFDEAFSLSQIFIEPNAYFVERSATREIRDEIGRGDEEGKRVVVSLTKELLTWLTRADADDTIRVLSGGPGSGKSSFSRIFAASVAREGKSKVLFVPLHLIDPSKDIVDEVGLFVRDEGVLIQNPLDSESAEPNLLLVFDGLDELASQGKAAAETSRLFVREVEKMVQKRNLSSARLKVLISGRELVIQENQSDFRRKRQILNLLPYLNGSPR